MYILIVRAYFNVMSKLRDTVEPLSKDTGGLLLRTPDLTADLIRQ